MLRTALIVSIVINSLALNGQEIIRFNAIYNNSFKEWSLDWVENSFDEDSEIINGKIELSWSLTNQWNDFLIDIDGQKSTVTKKDIGTMTTFELFGESNVFAKRVWPRDDSEWRIKSSGVEYTLKVLFGNDPEEWILLKESTVVCNILTEFKGDPRDWVIDYHTEAITPSEVQKMAIVIIIHTVCPKL